jgi:hypothetical protein
VAHRTGPGAAAGPTLAVSNVAERGPTVAGNGCQDSDDDIGHPDRLGGRVSLLSVAALAIDSSLLYLIFAPGGVAFTSASSPACRIDAMDKPI